MQNRIKLEDRINKFISDVKTQGMELKFEKQMLEFKIPRFSEKSGEQSPFFLNQLLNFKIKC